MRSGGPFKKSLVRAYHRHSRGGDVYVPAHQRANPNLIVGLLTQEHERAVPAAPATQAEAPPATAWKGVSATVAERQQQREALMKEHNVLAQARAAEKAAGGSADDTERDAQMARAESLRAELRERHGQDYENHLEGRLVANYKREIEQEAARWAYRLGHRASRDGQGNAEGIFDLLNTEATTAAWMALRRRTSDNRQGLSEALQSAIRQHLTRHWREALGGDTVTVGIRQNADLQKISKFENEYVGVHEELPDDEQVAKATGMLPERVSELRQLQASLFGQSLQGTNEAGDAPADRIATDGPGPEDLAVAEDTARVLQEALRGITDPVRRALLMVDVGMHLDDETVAQIVESERLSELAIANGQAREELGPDAPDGQVAARAVQLLQWPDGTRLDQKQAAAAQLLRFGNEPARLLTEDYLHPHTGTVGVVTPAEFYRRLGYQAKDASQSIKTGLAQLRKHPAMVALEDAMVKALDVALPLGWDRLLRNLLLIDRLDAVAHCEMLDTLWKSLTCVDPLTGNRIVRHERQAEATILRAVMTGDRPRAEVQCDSLRGSVYERLAAECSSGPQGARPPGN